MIVLCYVLKGTVADWNFSRNQTTTTSECCLRTVSLKEAGKMTENSTGLRSLGGEQITENLCCGGLKKRLNAYARKSPNDLPP